VRSGALRIGVDGRAFASPAGGVRRYVSELYREILELPAVEVVAIGAPDNAPLPAGMQRRAARAFPTNLGWMAMSLPLAFRGAGLDVFHAPAYSAPLWGVHPQVVTIHDVSYERRPEWNAYRNDPLRRRFYRASALAADRIVTDSTFSRDEIHAAYGIPSDRIDVIPLAAASVFTPGACDPAALPPGVTQPYALHVGDLHVRRNLSTALDAILRLRSLRNSPTHQFTNSPIVLVCAGIDRGVGPALAAQARAAGDAAALALTGPVDEHALLNLYRGAAMLLYPSRYEGFGLPILEAMQCGVPVAGSRSASIPELIGDAGVLVGELDVDGWTRAIVSLSTDAAHADAMRARGLARAATFSWARTARETVEAFRRAVRA